jgi:hypothetical protein
MMNYKYNLINEHEQRRSFKPVRETSGYYGPVAGRMSVGQGADVGNPTYTNDRRNL